MQGFSRRRATAASTAGGQQRSALFGADRRMAEGHELDVKLGDISAVRSRARLRPCRIIVIPLECGL